MATETYKISKDLALPLMHDIFKLRKEQTYNLMQNSYFCTPCVNSVYDGAAGISFLGPRIHLILIRVGFLGVHFFGRGGWG